MSLASRLSKMEQRITLLEAANASLSGQLHDLLSMLEKEEDETPKAIDFVSGTQTADRDETQSLG